MAGSLELCLLALQTYFKGLTFPFNLTYFDFSTDCNLEDISLVIFPENYSSAIGDIELFDCLISCLINIDNSDIKLEILWIFSWTVASRLSILTEDI